MNRSTAIATLAAVLVSIASYNVLSIDAQWDAKASAAEVTPGPKQIMGTGALMKMMVDPTFDELKAAIETMPEKRRDWQTLYIAAFSLAEINNLFYLRTDEEYMGTPEWTEAVAKSQEQTIDLAKAIKAKSDYGLIKEKFMGVMQSCNECHTQLAPDEEVSELEAPESWEILLQTSR